MTPAFPDRPHDWQDCHAGPLSHDYQTARQAYEAGFAALPGWVDIALNLRDRIVGRFGLTTVTNGAMSMTTLPVLYEDPESYEVGLIDRHLTFTLRTQRQSGQVSITTRIWFNHWLGRAYLAVVLIPHKIIVRHAIRAVA
jgi:hypothetical protein